MSASGDIPTDAQHDASDRDVLAELVSNALELRDAGRADWLDTACVGRPATRAAVIAAVARADALHGLIGRTSEHDALRGAALGGRFALRERIGSGAMGVVYMADDLELGRKVACKVVHHGLMAPREAVARFTREAEAMAAVQHPAVVTIHDRGRTDDDQVYIVMELVDGRSLSDVLDAARARARDWRGDDATWIRDELGLSIGDSSYVRTVVRWTADLALGLEAVHAAGVLHRDIKPSNVIVRRDGRPTLLDFGIALLDEQGGGTRTSASVGTPAYMAPEALRRDVPRTAASDVYGLAATLYHLLTLSAPYEGTPTQILTALATREPVPAAQRRPGLPRDLQAVLDRGMHRNPARRYQSAAAFEADLRAFLEHRPVTARAVTPVERALRKLARSRVALGAAAALVLVAVALGARAWREHALDVRHAEYAEIARRLPPNFTVVGAANREVRDPADRAALARLLDDAAAVAVRPLPSRLLRASFRQDHGDPDGATSDMRAVADDVRSDLARELAARYAAADRGVRGVGAIDLDGLPAPASAVDRYLLGYHELRRDRTASALALLGEPDVRRIAHAEELFLAFTSFAGLDRPAAMRLAGERFEDLLRLESRNGARTAATAHVAGRMLAILDRHEDALDAYGDGMALAPRAHVTRLSAGYCAYVLGDTKTARQHLDVARELKPQYAHVVQNLVYVEVAERRYDAALELVRAVEPQLVPPSPGFADDQSGWICAHAALDADAAGDAAERARRLEQARTFYALVPETARRTGSTAPRIVAALEKNDDQALLVALADQLAAEPRSWWRLHLLHRHFPDDLGKSATAGVRRVLEALAPNPITAPSK